MPQNQTVAEMAVDVLARQAGTRAPQTGETFEEALKAILETEAGRQLLVSLIRLGGSATALLRREELSPSPRPTIPAYRFTEERLTSNRRAAADLDMPSSTALTILARRSSE